MAWRPSAFVVRARITLTIIVWASVINANPVAARERFQCSIETQAAEAIIKLRDQGQPKASVLAPLPPRKAVFDTKKGSLQAKLAVQMYSIIEDVYANLGIKAGAYLEYRTISCNKRNAGLKAPVTFSEISLPMFHCQDKYGNEPSAQLTRCVKEVFEYYQANAR